MNIIDELNVKVMKAQMLSEVQHDDTFQKLTAATHIATYKVNNRRCLGVTFEDPHDANIKSLEAFCKRVLLESATITIPWDQGRTIVFIRPIGRWSSICLRHAAQNQSTADPSNIQDIDF